MAWIAVHEEVIGKKLRGFRKMLHCSEAEALGILVTIWLWARKNADTSGLLGNVDEDDIAMEIRQKVNSSIDADHAVQALITCEWLDKKENGIYVHDWYEWQMYWYSYLEKKEKDKERKRKERVSQKEQTVPKATPTPEPSEKPKKPKETVKPKQIYAEDVKMYPEEYDKLIAKYGEAFTAKLIEELNNYKLSVGKKYKDDYRAILNWVVEKCDKKYPNLKGTLSTTDMPFNPDINPFENL